MEAARSPRRRRRARRGTVDRPVNASLVRVASVVVAPALLAFLFSISTTGTLPSPPLEPLFDARAAVSLASQLSSEFPARRPGTEEAAEAARWFEEEVAAFGLPSETDSWTEEIAELGPVELRNVVVVVPGRSDDTIVVVAHRDNAGAEQPRGDNASGTAALIELARGYGPQEAAPAPLPQRTLVFVSTDGGAYGGAGAARFAHESPYAATAIAAIVLDGIGGGGRPRLAISGDRPVSPARTLVSTASARIAEQVGSGPALPSVASQLVDLGIPYAAGEQGSFLARDIAALTITTQERGDPSVPVGDPGSAVAGQRLGQLGRATEALIGSIDVSVGAAFRTPDSLFLDGRAGSGWAFRLTLIAAVAPFVLGVLDLTARARRRGLAFRSAIRALRTRILLWVYGALLLWVSSLLGLLPTGAPLPLPPYADGSAQPYTATLVLLAAAFALGWLIARRRLVPSSKATPEDRLAGYAVALAWLALLAVAIALTRPYALVFVLPSLYAWLWLPIATRHATRVALYLLGLLGPVLALTILGRELGLGVLETSLYAVSLVSVGYVAPAVVLLTALWLAAATQLGALALGRYAPYAGGVDPPPAGVVRTTVASLARAARGRRYARST